jgi:hypothetical protein
MNTPANFDLNRRSHPASTRLPKAPKAHQGKTIPESARYEHDRQQEIANGIPPSGRKKPE